MIDFTPDAQKRFDEYLQRMRSTMRGRRAVEPEEVEQNVVEHVEVALAEVPSPVDSERLGEVLAQLGPPEGWLPDDDRAAWRRAMDRLMTGPEDWRLAYASFGLTLLMILAFPIGGILLLVPAFLLSRASIELIADRGEPLGARRWLVLPPIYLALFFVAAIVLFGPPAVVGSALGEGTLRDLRFTFNDHFERGRLLMGFVSMAAGVWWIVLSGLLAMLMRPFRTLFAPVTSGMRRGHALVLTIAGLVVAGIGAALMFAF